MQCVLLFKQTPHYNIDNSLAGSAQRERRCLFKEQYIPRCIPCSHCLILLYLLLHKILLKYRVGIVERFTHMRLSNNAICNRHSSLNNTLRANAPSTCSAQLLKEGKVKPWTSNCMDKQCSLHDNRPSFASQLSSVAVGRQPGTGTADTASVRSVVPLSQEQTYQVKKVQANQVQAKQVTR